MDTVFSGLSLIIVIGAAMALLAVGPMGLAILVPRAGSAAPTFERIEATE